MEKDTKELAAGLELLTEPGGPLHLLIDEVRNSNSLALRNVRLQILSLVALFLCLVCLFFLSYVFYEGMAKLSRSEGHLESIMVRLENTEFSVASMEEEMAEAPKIVADNEGKLTVVATIQLEEGYGELQQKVGEGVEEAEQELDRALSKVLGIAPASRPKKRRAAARPTKVEIPLDMQEAHELK